MKIIVFDQTNELYSVRWKKEAVENRFAVHRFEFLKTKKWMLRSIYGFSLSG